MIFSLDLKLLSYNQYYRNNKNGKRIKTGAGHAYDEELGLLLEDHANALRLFGEGINPATNIVRLQITMYSPDFYIKDNSRLSMTCGDIDNPVKVFQDKLFKVIGTDDYIIKSLQVDQYPGAEHRAIIGLEILPLSSIEYSPIW